MGSGPGELAAAAAALGADTVGIDVAPSMVRRAAIAHPSIPFRIGSFERDPGRRRGVRRRRGQLRAQPRRAGPTSPWPRRGGSCGPAAGWRSPSWDAPRRNRLLGLLVDAVAAADAPPPRGLPAGPHELPDPTPSCGRCSSAAGFRDVGVSHIMFEAAVPDAGHPVARRPGLRGPAPAAGHRAGAGGPGARSATASSRWWRSTGGRRVAGDPGRGPGHPGAAAMSGRAGSGRSAVARLLRGRVHGRARRVRRGGRAAVLRGPGRRAPVLVPGRVRGRPRRVEAGPASCRSSPRCWGRSGRTWTCSGSSTCRSWARSRSRCGSPCWRCRGERLETITRVYSISAALAQADAFLRSRPWTVQTTLQHGRRGEAGRGARRGRGRGGGLGAGRRDLRAGGAGRRHPVRDRQPDAVRGDRAAGRRPRPRPCWRRRARTAVAGPGAHVAGVRRAQRAGAASTGSLGAFATRGLNLSRLESRPWTARVGALGVPVLGGPRRRTRPTRRAPRPSTSCGARPSWCGSWAPIRGRPRTEAPGRRWGRPPIRPRGALGPAVGGARAAILGRGAWRVTRRPCLAVARHPPTMPRRGASPADHASPWRVTRRAGLPARHAPDHPPGGVVGSRGYAPACNRRIARRVVRSAMRL